MTPYTKQIVELHKIHKAIENCGCNKDEQGGGDSESSNIFFSPVGIQPTHIVTLTGDTFSIIEIKDFTLSADSDFIGSLIYPKEGLINIGVNENDLNNLEIVSFSEIQEDIGGLKGLAGNYIDNILNENYVIGLINYDYNNCDMIRIIKDSNEIPVIYRLGDNLYVFNTIQGEVH